MDGHTNRGRLLYLAVATALVFGLFVADSASAATVVKAKPVDGPNQLTGGPDTYGYYFVDQAEPILTYQFQDISSSGTLVVSGDEAGTNVALSEPFDFYGTTYNSMVMSTNGYLSSDATDPGTDNTNDCPIPANPDIGGGARMYPLHDNLVTGAGYMEYFATCPRTNELAIDGGTEGCTVFQWDDTNHFGSTATFNMQTILYHTSGVILHQIAGDPAQGALSTTGIQEVAGADGLQYACDTPGSVVGNAAVAFYTCLGMTLSPATLPSAQIGVPYNAQVVASGGTPAYTYALTAGALPPGLNLDANTGVISGTPTALGNYTFDITATDAKGCTATVTYFMAVDPSGCATITVNPSVLPNGTEMVFYSVTFSASGGTAPYTWSSTGALPAGLTLDVNTGVLSGTPTATGDFTFTVTATDSTGCTQDSTYCLVIGAVFNIVAGHGLGFNAANSNAVTILDGNGNPSGVAVWEAYGAGQWGTNVASGNVRVDGGAAEYAEILTGPGPGDVYGPHVRGWDRTGGNGPINKINFFAYGTLKFGVNVGAGNIEGNETCNGLDEILTGAGPGAVFGPHVRAFNFDGGPLQSINKVNFFAYSTLKWGVNVEDGDVDGDGFSEILTGAGPGQIFAPTVRGFNFDGQPIQSIAKINFNAFAPLNWGVNVSGGDVDADGWHEIAATRGPGSGLSAEFAAWDYDGGPINALANYTITPYTTMYGGRIGHGDGDSDARWDLIAAQGRDPAAGSQMGVWSFATGSQVEYVTRADVFPGTSYGVNVAGARLGY